MISYPHVEDYIELLAGYEPNSQNSALLHPLVSKLVRLARYDVNIVDNMAHNTMWGTALTDGQASLAIKLILKYRRQLTHQGVDITPIEHPKFRIPLRSVDKNKSITIDNNVIHIKFPYNKEYIQSLQNLRDASCGLVKFDHSTKIWQVNITEYTINFIVTWGQINDFEISPSILALLQVIRDCESQPYKLMLVQEDNLLKITNGEQSLIDYINQNCGGFETSNLLNLIDLAGILGYTVDSTLLKRFPICVSTIAPHHSLHLTPGLENLTKIFDYAKITNRYPIYIYEPGAIGLDQSIDLSQFSAEQILKYDHNGKSTREVMDFSEIKVIHACKIPKSWNKPVPLLITTVEMMFGGRKVDWTRRAERIIYYTHSMLRT
jgi:hypothetical protein